MTTDKKIRLAGLLILSGMCSGIFSVAPAVDSKTYLTAAAQNSNGVLLAAVFQFIMSLTYMGVAILLYPEIKRFNRSLSIGFLGFRILAAALSIIGTTLLLAVLALSEAYLQNPSQGSVGPGLLGNVLKASRDYVNHVFMVLVLCTGNYLCYLLLYRSKLIPQWLSLWGMVGAFLAVSASILFLFRQVDVITYGYLALNVPTAIHELVLGIWLIVKGFNKSDLQPAAPSYTPLSSFRSFFY
ncbi:hypothetical protein ABIE26_003682 [Pedobacter africanus]|uniref:Uncharacterized protein n=1 Tax=Pedobacter africanus TaxID=151894 RepID=A0ACC6L0F6_9SPHI|nr:DUF4386 domain-containing protein [Pedobacter africanus]MDR6784984.1 hypothetical protein [Pedobacter africanus]